MSLYDPIWNALKDSPGPIHTKSVVVNRNLHARIIKAVIKRKWLDVGFKVAIEPKIAHLTYTREGNTITFYLSVVYPKTMRHLESLTTDKYGRIIL